MGTLISGGVVMPEIEELLRDVDSLREKLMYLIDDKQGDLIDAEVVNLSRVLNATLNQYNKVIEEKLKRQEL